MKKSVLVLFLSLCCTFVVKALPTVDYKGGDKPKSLPASNEALWTAMWNDFKAVYTMITYEGITIPLVSQTGTGYSSNNPAGNEKSIARFLQNCFYNGTGYTDPKYTAIFDANAINPWKTGGCWEWLGDYFKAIQPTFSGTDDNDILAYIYNTQAFVQGVDITGTTYDNINWGSITADEADYWQLAYMLGTGLYPTKTDCYFAGWNTSADGTGTPITKVSQLKDLTGTVYATWISTLTDLKTITFDLQNGHFEYPLYPDYENATIATKQGNPTSNEELWKSFMTAVNTYFGENKALRKLESTEKLQHPVATFTTVGKAKDIRSFLHNNSPWKWLGDYIGSRSSTAPNTEARWRYEVQGLMMQVSNTKTEAPGHSYIQIDWTVHGTPAEWLPYWKFNNVPVKAGREFVGWFTEATGGTQIKSLSQLAACAGTTVYAHWSTGLAWHEDIIYDKDDPTIITGENVHTPPLILTKDGTWEARITGADGDITWQVVDDKGNVIPLNHFEVADKPDPNNSEVKVLTITRTSTTLAGKFHLKGTDKAGNTIQFPAADNQYIWVPIRLEKDAGQDKLAQKYIYAYDLRAKFWPEKNGGTAHDYEFYFKANAVPTSGKVYLYKAADKTTRIHTANITIPASYKVGDEMSVVIPEATIIEEAGADYQTQNIIWEVELTAPEAPTFGYTHVGAIPDNSASTGVLAVNTAPQTPTFGRAYTYFRFKGDEVSTNGSFIYTADMDSWANKYESTFGRMARMAIDKEGDVYFTDKSSSHPGIYIGEVNEYHPERMPIHPFFGDGITTEIDETYDKAVGLPSDQKDTEGHYDYPILTKTINGQSREIGSAIMAVDTYVRKDANGKDHGMLFAYAKGHSEKWGANQDYNKNGTDGLNKTGGDPSKYHWENMYADVQNGHIPYHSILIYDLGVLEDGLDLTWNDARIDNFQVIPIWGNHHAAHTANIWATSKGLWICHDRVEGQNNNWAASLLFYNAVNASNTSSDILKENPAYTSAVDIQDAPEVNKYINGSDGGAFAFYDYDDTEKGYDLLILQNATHQLLLFKVTWVNQTPKGMLPTLELINVYEHDQQSYNQMNFDYAGNLFCAGANGLSVFTIPEIRTTDAEMTKRNNTQITPARDLFTLSHNLYYDHIFDNGTGNHDWHNAGNWNKDVVPGPESVVRIDDNVTITQSDAEVAALDLNKKGDNTIPTITVEPTGSLYYTGKLPKSLSKNAKTNPEIQVVENGQPTTNKELDVFGNVILKAKKEQKATLQHLVKIPATVEIDTHGRMNYEDDTHNPWQHIAVPFYQASAGTNFYGSIMYQWKEQQRNWSELIGTHYELHRFNGYLLSHDDVYYPIDKGQTYKHILQGTLKHYVDEAGLTVDNKNTINLAYTEGDGSGAQYEGMTAGWNYLGNSWTAPIYIEKFEDADFVNDVELEDGNYDNNGVTKPYTTQAAIYLYDKGFNYKAIPIKLVKELGIDADYPTIPALYSFYVYAGKDAKLTLDYERLTTPPDWEKASTTSPSTPQPMPQRRAQATKLNHEKMHITVTGEKGDMDELYLFEGAQYSNEMDNGYEALKMGGDGAYLAATTSLGDMAVVATPLIEGTLLNFAKNWSTTYTFSFVYNGTDDLSLEDKQTGTLTPITTGATYRFATTDDDSQRFQIVRKRENTDVTTSTVNIWATDNSLYMNNPAGELLEICVYGADGKLVLQKQTRESVAQLEVPMHGVYTIRVTSNNNVQTIKHIL